MVSKKVTILNETGLHARPAAQFSQFCKNYGEKIIILSNGKETDPKSIIQLMAAGLKKGTEVEVKVEGENESIVCDEVVSFIENLKE